MLAHKIHPIKEKCWECKQSKFSQVPKCPLRMLAIGPSGSGKSVALQNMVLDTKIDILDTFLFVTINALIYILFFYYLLP